MEQRNKLTLMMGMFYMFVILCLGLIVINEKKKDLLIPKIESKIETYIKKTYKDNNEFKYSKTKRYSDKYIMKVYNYKNKDLYFEVIYYNNKITDTYKKDYLEGRTLNHSIEKYLNNMLKDKVKDNDNNFITYKIVYNTKLTNCTNYVKKKLINGKYLLPIYTIYVETNLDNDINTTLNEVKDYTNKIKLTPKNYHIIINNQEEITKSIDIVIDNDTINNNLDEIVKLINENNLKELNKYNVKCKYLN